MTKRILGLSLAAVVLTGGVFAFRAFNRPDCPGKIICPITGEVICADQCPARTTAVVSVEKPSCCKDRK
jgi:hypothetical protein